MFECSSSYTGSFHSFWNISNIKPFVSPNAPLNSNIDLNGDDTGTTVILPVFEQDSMDVQCGLCDLANCAKPLQATVISLPVQLISFGK